MPYSAAKSPSTEERVITQLLETERLKLREANIDDAPFMLQLLTEPSWQRFIARHEIKTVDQACTYLQERIIPAYETGLGFWVIQLTSQNTAAGICGLVKRPFLEEVDLGFALLEEHWGSGLAYEAALAVIAHAQEKLHLNKLQAITVPHNSASVKLLEKLGFAFKDHIKDEEGEELALYEQKLGKLPEINLVK